MIKSNPFNHNKLSLVTYLASLLVICIFLNGFPLTKLQADNPTDSVYCPLMKKWVKKNPPMVHTKSENPLIHICATDDKKKEFFNDLEKSLRLSRSSKITDSVSLFFSYLKSGKEAFKSFSEPINIPSQLPFLANKIFTTNGSSKINLFLKQTEQVVYLQTRPPTVTNTFTPHKLKDISNKISPRAPPFFI